MDVSLVDQYCASALSAPITAVAFDSQSGARVEADEWGTVAITKPGDHYPGIVFDMGSAVRGAVAVSPGGSLVAVGDDQGSVTVYKRIARINPTAGSFVLTFILVGCTMGRRRTTTEADPALPSPKGGSDPCRPFERTHPSTTTLA